MAAISGSMMALAALAAAGGAVVANKMAKKAGLPVPDPIVSKLERVRTETDIAQKAASKLAQRNKALKASSLVADPLAATSALTNTGGGKTVLGQ